MFLLFIFMHSLSVMLYSSELLQKEVQFHTRDSSRAVYNAAGGTVNESGVTVNNFFGTTQLRQHSDAHVGLEISETDELQARDSLFEFKKMSLENRIKHEEEIKLLYMRALETGDHSTVLNRAKEKDPFAQIYWCMLTITPSMISSRATIYFERGKRFFEIGEERKPIQRSGVFSLLSGFLSEHVVSQKKAKPHYFEAADTFENEEAQFRLAVVLHDEGEIEEAKKYYQDSAKQGNLRAMAQLNKLLEELSLGDNSPLSSTTTEEALTPQKLAISEKEQREIYNAALLKANNKEAFKDLLAIAEHGYADAQHEVGNRYYEGRGVSQNLQIARDWWRRAADNGIEQARYKLNIT